MGILSWVNISMATGSLHAVELFIQCLTEIETLNTEKIESAYRMGK